MHELYSRRGIYFRGLADRVHMIVPGWKQFLEWFGAVKGTRAGCRELMESGQTILVYPGGGREVMKRKSDPKHSLMWKG